MVITQLNLSFVLTSSGNLNLERKGKSIDGQLSPTKCDKKKKNAPNWRLYNNILSYVQIALAHAKLLENGFTLYFIVHRNNRHD